eukprot:294841-Pyramimonas_sp.AAC.1
MVAIIQGESQGAAAGQPPPRADLGEHDRAHEVFQGPRWAWCRPWLHRPRAGNYDIGHLTICRRATSVAPASPHKHRGHDSETPTRRGSTDHAGPRALSSVERLEEISCDHAGERARGSLGFGNERKQPPEGG